LIALELAALLALAVTCAGVALARGWWRGRAELREWLGFEPHARRRLARVACALGALAFGAAALHASILAPPQLAGAELDLLLAMDVSRSMSASDAPPSRLRRAVRFAERVLDARPALRAGLVIFAGDAFTALPLTLDHEALRVHLRALDTDLISARGSDLSRALRQAASAFDRESERPRAILLLSDGEHAGASVDAEIPALRRLGVRVFAVGFGSPTGAAVPAGDGGSLSDRAGREVRSARNDTLLARVTAGTGGRYLRELEEQPDARALLAELHAAPPRAAPLVASRILALLVAALACLACEAVLALEPCRAPRRWILALARPRAALVAAASLILVAAVGDVWIERGDEQLRSGEDRAALGSFQRAQREGETSAALELRIANALQRLGENERAGSAYLEALRRAAPQDAELRFVANFNLGVALLDLEQFDAAREAFWEALGERPDDLEAKFNYEWAAERAEKDAGEKGDADPPPDPDAQQDASGEARAQTLDAQEARRWLESLEDSPREPLRRQIARELRERGRPTPPLGGQTW
jgi:Ca-activated chloride channel homolog